MNRHRERDPMESVPEAQQLLAELAGMQTTDAAAAFLDQLADAVMPRSRRDIAHLTWREHAERRDAPVDPRAAAEAQLRAAERRFRALVEQIPAVTFMAVLGEGKNEVYVSPHIEQMLGFTQEEWLENPFLWYTQLHPADRQLWNVEFSRGVRTGGPFKAECRFVARSGAVVWVHGEARIIKDEHGRPSLLQGVAFDITEAKRAQEIVLARAVETAKHQEEVAIAHRIQTQMLPRSLTIEGLEFASAMTPAEEVGGDYFDVLPARDGAWIAVGDVAGHGLSAGLIMLLLQSAVAATTRSLPDARPSDVIHMVNSTLYEAIHGRLERDEHVTFSLMRYTHDGRLVFAGAHEHVLVWRAHSGRVDALRTDGTWLAVTAEIERYTTDTTVQLEDGDVVVLYTDGITEAMNREGRMFDFDRLVAAIEGGASRAPVDIVRAITDAVAAWMHVQLDDQSLLVFRYQMGAGARHGG